MNLTLFVSINVAWILSSASCFSGDGLFANAFARGWISELCCPCDLSTFNLQTKTMHILTFFMAIFLQYSSTFDSTHVIWFGETWIKFLAFTSCAKYIVLNKQLKTCCEENERNVNNYCWIHSIPPWSTDGIISPANTRFTDCCWIELSIVVAIANIYCNIQLRSR